MGGGFNSIYNNKDDKDMVIRRANRSKRRSLVAELVELLELRIREYATCRN